MTHTAPSMDNTIASSEIENKNSDSIEDTTREIFEKILEAKNTPNPNQSDISKKELLLAKQAQEQKDNVRVAKKTAQKEQLQKEKEIDENIQEKESLLLAAKKKQEMLAAQNAKTIQERLAKKQKKQARKEKQKRLKEKIQKEKQKEKEKKEKKVQRKAKLAQKEAHKKHQALIQKKALAKKVARKKESQKNPKKHISKQASKSSHRKEGHSTQNMIYQFYGNEFNTFTGTQQKFIKENLGNIYVITQTVLSHKGYPFRAKQRHQQGIQLVTFYLHPNGRISKLHFVKRLKYKVLNDNTLKIIRLAHHKYPKPKTTTKITFFVVYTLE